MESSSYHPDTRNGNVAQGCLSILSELPIQQVNVKDLDALVRDPSQLSILRLFWHGLKFLVQIPIYIRYRNHLLYYVVSEKRTGRSISCMRNPRITLSGPMPKSMTESRTMHIPSYTVRFSATRSVRSCISFFFFFILGNLNRLHLI